MSKMGDTLMSDKEFTRGYLPAEFIAGREKFFVDVSGRKTFLGCSDERELTPESGARLAAQYPEAVPPIEAFTSVYGGTAGVTKNILIAGIAQYGSIFIEEYGDYAALQKHVIERLGADEHAGALVPALHSAANKEHNAAEFNPASDDDVACAYALGIGATSSLIVDRESIIQQVARFDQITVHGNDKDFERLLDAHFEFLQQATNGKKADFALNRAEYAEAKAAIMILVGTPHAAAKTTGLINNYSLDTVRGSNAAAKADMRYYNQDIARVAAAVLRNFPEMKLEPELLMRAFLLDSTPVRAVLASGDPDPALHGVLDPRNLRMGIRGDVQATVKSLSAAV